MTREQLAHVLRAAARLVPGEEMLIVGSQAILGSFSEDELPEEAAMSIEADIAFREDSEDEKANQVDGAIGESSQFHAMNGYYAQGVSISTATLPKGWEQRVVAFDRIDGAPGQAVCLEAHDLVVSKVFADRPKDRDFCIALLEKGLISAQTLLERASQLDEPEAVIRRVQASIRRHAKAAGLGL